MTRIDFFFNVAHKYRQVAILGEKAVSKGRRVFVLTGDVQATEALEMVLWSSPPAGFLPHCRSNASFVAETPLVIDWQSGNLPHDDILINLRPEQPPFFSRFRRLIELVSTDDADREGARGRYRFYRDCGYEIRSIDASGNHP
jgi:DNA polymerase-3 subunit chi